MALKDRKDRVAFQASVGGQCVPCQAALIKPKKELSEKAFVPPTLSATSQEIDEFGEKEMAIRSSFCEIMDPALH